MASPLLITGVTGLLGQELMHALSSYSRPWQVHTAGRPDLSGPDEALALVERVQPAAVVHLAGGTSPDRHELYVRNVLTTVHLLDAVARLPAPPYCIVFGSAAEYGETSESPISETALLRPVSEYGRAKVAGTTLAESIGRARGIPLTVLRPFNVVSPRLPASTALGNMRRQLLGGEGEERTVICGRLDLVRDYVPASSVAEVILHLLANPAPGETLNVCSGTGITLGSILDAMARQRGVRLGIVQSPELLGIPAAPRVVGDPSRLFQATGIRIEATAESLAEILLA